jgi:hypothetical protein
MTVISLLSFVVPSLNLDALGQNIEIVFPNILFLLFVVVFSLIQFLYRAILTSKHYIKDKVFFSINMKKSKLYSRVISYIAIILLFMWPVIASKNLSSNITIGSMINLLVWIVIIEIIPFISYKYTKIYFMTDGILIRGMDFRIDIPLNPEIFNHSGFYPYYDIQQYSIHNNYLRLSLYNNSGVIEGYIPNERIKPIAAFLESKKIKFKKIN